MEFNNRNTPHDQSKFQGFGQVVNVTEWNKDKPYEEGARKKYTTFCPENAPYPFLISHHRYMFKQSDKKYPGDFLAEILAYRVGIRMGIPVAPVFVAIDDERKVAGGLSEWFYDYPDAQKEGFFMGGDILQKVIPNYDRGKGTQHNLRDIIEILNRWENADSLKRKGFQTLIYDTFIGNGDRHQDNWGLVTCSGIFLSPAFDNGSAMGHEILEDKLASKDVDAYIKRGAHHMKLNRNDKKPAKHIELIEYVLSTYSEAKDILSRSLDFDVNDIQSDMAVLKEIQESLPYQANWLTETRIAFMSRLFVRRYELLNELLA